MTVLAMAGFILVGLMGGSAGDQTPTSLIQVRGVYLEAVHEESAIERGMAAIESARAAAYAQGEGLEDLDETEATVLRAYEGALITLRAKHGVWPPARLRHLRDGLEILDESVAAAPYHAEVRYLRLLSAYFLPGILGRGQSVREDLAALAELLPAAAGSYPPDLYRTMVRFVLQNGELEPPQRAALEAVIPSEADV